MLQEFQQTQILGMTIQQWLIFVATFFLLFLGLVFIRRLFSKLFSKESRFHVEEVQKVSLLVVDNTKMVTLFLLSLLIAMWTLDIKAAQAVWMKRGVILVAIFQLAIWGRELISYLVDRYVERKLGEDASLATGLKFSSFLLRVIFYAILVLLALDNLGVDVTTMLAGLGVGGIAIALAAQNVLGDLFASLSIVLDKPFVIGDFIIVGDKLGTVEKIGLKTTRVRSLSGEMLVFPNSDLLQSRVHNYQQMNERRVVFQFGVIYQTPLEKLKQIPEFVKAIIDDLESVRFDRAHFKSFGDSSYDFEVVFWMLTSDYTAYMDAQQEVNLKLVEKFESENISFAYPTRTIYMEQA